MKEKTIVVNYLGRKGGGPVYAYEMTKGLIGNGYKVIVFLSSDIENIASWKKLSLEHLEIIDTYSSVFSFLKNTVLFKLFKLPKLKKKFSGVQVDACYMPMDHPWSGYINEIFPEAQTIYTIHDPIPHSTNHKFLNKLTGLYKGIDVSQMDDIVILSNVFKKHVMCSYGFAEEKVHVIPHGIFDFYKTVEGKSIIEYPKGKKNFLFFGRICAYKGLDVLAEAFGIIQKQRDDFALTIAGNGDFSIYKNFYDEIDNVTVINRWIKDEEVGSLFKTDEELYLVVPYVDATQSGVIPIAMSYGVPVLASATGGLVEQVDDGKTGYLFEVNNANALAECMIRVADNDNSEIVSEAEKFIASLSWNSLSNELGRIIHQ